MRFRNLRTHLAVEVVAAAMPDTVPPLSDDQLWQEWAELSTAVTRRGAILNCALHALITHDRYHTGHQLTEAPDAATFTKIVEQAIRIGESCKGTWNGWEYAWESHAERLTRYIESVCTYYVPEAAA